MRPVFVVLPLALLAACATPREQCISDVSRDFRVLNSLVAQTQANLARGYAVVEEQWRHIPFPVRQNTDVHHNPTCRHRPCR